MPSVVTRLSSQDALKLGRQRPDRSDRSLHACCRMLRENRCTLVSPFAAPRTGVQLSPSIPPPSADKKGRQDRRRKRPLSSPSRARADSTFQFSRSSLLWSDARCAISRGCRIPNNWVDNIGCESPAKIARSSQPFVRHRPRPFRKVAAEHKIYDSVAVRLNFRPRKSRRVTREQISGESYTRSSRACQARISTGDQPLASLTSALISSSVR